MDKKISRKFSKVEHSESFKYKTTKIKQKLFSLTCNSAHLSFKYSTKHIQHLHTQIALSLFTDRFYEFASRPTCLGKCNFILTLKKGFIIKPAYDF